LSLENPFQIAGHRATLISLMSDLRPELHRYCSRMMGSVIEGEDVVQDAIVRALVALENAEAPAALRPWLFRIAHNRAIDLLRNRAIRASDPIEYAIDIADQTSLAPVDHLLQQEAVKTALSRFTELPLLQRSVIILKDVLEEPLRDIAALLGMSTDAVKGHLARARANLKAINAKSDTFMAPKAPSAEVMRYVALFNTQDWDSLRALLADDVKLHQSLHGIRAGAKDVGMFFTIYAQSETVQLVPAFLDGREVLLVMGNRADMTHAYFMWLQWRGGLIRFIRDYRYVQYIMTEATFHIITP
jgi:RNA polymerase sigma factor (sigma-70 family)